MSDDASEEERDLMEEEDPVWPWLGACEALRCGNKLSGMAEALSWAIPKSS